MRQVRRKAGQAMRRNRAINLSKPLSVRRCPSGVLSIDIGMDVLAFAAISIQDWQPDSEGRKLIEPGKVFTITNKRGFAGEVIAAMTEEREDGSSILSDMLDKASQKAIDDGSIYFWNKADLAKERKEQREARKLK